MGITLNHTIVPARDKIASAKFLAKILGPSFNEEAVGFFAPLRINETLTLDFDEAAEPFHIHHYAFKVSESDFDTMFSRIRAEGIPYGSGPQHEKTWLSIITREAAGSILRPQRAYS